MSNDEPVLRGEFEAVVVDVKRRLDGHDGLYTDLRATREELVRFTETLKIAREELAGGSATQVRCQENCRNYREAFERRMKILEQFRWEISGALVLLSVGVPLIIKFW